MTAAEARKIIEAFNAEHEYPSFHGEGYKYLHAKGFLEGMRSKEINGLVEAVERLITQFKVIGMHQNRLLIRGQNFDSASKNWEEAATNQVLEFEPLAEALAQYRKEVAE